jgi:4-amino-4-deoxy-L-arabinose transferase-like glycosyltransferase
MQRTRWSTSERARFILLILFTVFLALYNLDGYPVFSSLDEGFRLQLPKNLVLYGRWAVLTNDGFIPFWRDSTGPTILLPITLVFKVLGVSLWAARLIMALYLIGSVVTLYLCVRSLYNARVALLASLWFLFMGPQWLNTVAMGRWVYGEVPALVFLFLGCSIWFASLEDDNSRRLIAASICFGLATLTKDLLFFALVGSLLAVYMIDRVHFKMLKLRQVVVPSLFSIASIIGWSVFQWYMSSVQSFGMVDMPGDGLLAAARIRLLAFAPHLWYDSLKFLVEHGFILWAIPALAHTFLVALNRKDSLDTSRQLLFPFFVTIWMLWYVIASIGWHRYAYPGWAVSSILVAKFLCDLAVEFKIEWPMVFAPSQWSKFLPKLRNISVSLLILILVLWPAQNTVRRIVKGDNQTADEFAHYIETNLPPDVLIASAEWEIDFLTDRTYLHHPGSFAKAHIKHYQLGYPLEGELYNVAAYDPDYVINGPYNKDTGFISSEFLGSRGKLVVSIGEYDLYQVIEE